MVGLRPRIVSRSRAALCCTVGLFLVAQLALYHFVTRVRPELRDPEFGSLFSALQERLAEAPGRPLVLVLGSSRTANLFRPSALSAWPDRGRGPVVFNFATLSSGPLRQLQMLRRVLARGVTPSLVVAEIWTPYLAHREGFTEEGYVAGRDLQWPDWPLLAAYLDDPWPAYGRLLDGMLVPASSHRRRILECYAPFLLHIEPRQMGDWSDPSLRVEGCGWLPAPVPRPGPELFAHIVERTRAYARRCLEDFRITDVGDRAVRELVTTCTHNDIRIALVLAPEHSVFRACFSVEVEAVAAGYLAGLGREYRLPVVDVRDWVADEDFMDLSHALPRAAGPYTQRFGREVLLPLLQGKSLSPGLLVHETPASPSPPRPAP
jgi:hypothetical protein